MNGQVERKIVTVERDSFRQPEFNNFVLGVFDRFVAKIAVPPRDRKFLHQDFRSQIEDFSPYRDSQARVPLPNGLKFYFWDYLPKGVFRDEFNQLFDFNLQEVPQPIQTTTAFFVEVEHYSEEINKRVAERVFRFFQKLQEEGQPIELITPTEPIKGHYYYHRAVYVVIKQGAFKEGSQKIPVQSWPPSKVWVAEQLKEWEGSLERK